MNKKQIITNAILAYHGGFKPTLKGVGYMTLHAFFADLYENEKEAECKAIALWNASK